MSSPNGFDLSNRIYYVLIGLLAGLLIIALVGTYSVWKVISGGANFNEIVIESTGKAFISPDLAKIRIGVNTKEATTTAVFKENTTKINKINEIIKANGLTEQDLQTTYYSLNPNYNWSEAKENFLDGYILDQQITISVRDFTKIGNIIAESTSAGANSIYGIDYTVEDPEAAKSEAREKAIANAKEKAKVIAKQAGLRLGKVVRFSEYEPFPTDGIYPQYGGGGGYPIESLEGHNIVKEEVPYIEPGQKEVQLTVSITYKLK